MQPRHQLTAMVTNPGPRVSPDIAQAIIDAGRHMNAQGWVPATAGNLSMRDGAHIAITRSGCHKARLQPEDVILVDLDGKPVAAGRPSAETLLHCQLYQHDPALGAVLHGHSVPATVLSMAGNADALWFEDFEIQKALVGQTTHTGRVSLPVIGNDQDIARLATTIAPILSPEPVGYLLRGHGVYAWGSSMEAAWSRLEAIEFLLACRLAQRSLLP